jgi:hypothetical protein
VSAGTPRGERVATSMTIERRRASRTPGSSGAIAVVLLVQPVTRTARGVA